ncbi:putative matrix metalloproteinase [Ixodes scapularis]
MAKRRLPLVLLVTALLAAIDPSRQSPVKNNNNGNVRKSMETFLERFGYMGDTSSGSVLPSDNLRTEEGFRAALRRMQKFAGLPATGRLDQATARMMKARRCGVPDVIGHAERVRRYALQGSKWDKTHLTWR